MRFDDIWIQGTGRYAGEPRPAPEQVTAHSGILSVATSGLAGPELAVRAGRQALHQAGPGAVGPHLHGSMAYPGLDIWSSSCWVADRLLAAAPAMSLQFSALCNTSVAGIETAASLLAGRPDFPRVLLTVGDRFPETAIDRFEVDPEIALGDAGAAAVLGRGSGLARVLSGVSRTDPSLEGLQRGDEPFRDRPADGPAIVRKRTRQFFAAGTRTPASVVRAHVEGVREVVETALAEAGTSIGEARWVVPPFVGANAFEHGYERPLGLDRERTLFEFGLRLGHLGGSDHLFALDHLLRDRTPEPGDRIVLIGVGGGFTFTCAVLEIPAWARSVR
ncbi:3-oxoacyl-[acyl-carrier-protein] synthase III C-terminal domain-containing protein [Amycolatopsis sp. lyj-109]|uniref:3-oxoacyl-[acyl-carrier-protein] synthase III C-terminal domain-containing protein n=1 Tax=Amycolatopsis sp. lyj-109 TaxID=2789287 RepID=UPI00397DC711